MVIKLKTQVNALVAIQGSPHSPRLGRGSDHRNWSEVSQSTVATVVTLVA
jgi:hypothetical protein